MKLIKHLFVLLSISIAGWCELEDHVITDCLRLERGFLDLKEVGIYVVDRDENEELVRTISEGILAVFQESGTTEYMVNYISGPGLLNVLLTRENDQYIINVILISDFESQGGLLFVDCFRVSPQEMISKIQEKVRAIIADLASAGSYPTAYISE